MKLKIRSLVIVLVLVCILTSQAFAITFYYRASSGYDLIWSDDFVVAEILDLLTTQEFTAICNATPYASSYTYKVVISYDELAGLVTTANTHQLNTSLYRNDAAGYWVAKVHDYDDNPWFSNDNTPRVLGNPNGYVYVAEIDTTGEDMVSLLDSILVRLTLVESYVKSAYFELWEQGGVLDDIYDVIDSIDSYVYDIKDRLYYNGKSAAYYLYKIESHLATIANDSGTSDGSSSGTDLSGITTKLDTLTGLIGIIQLRADTLISQLESTNTYLSAVSTKLDDVATIATDLNSVQKYVFWISSDVEDALAELETVTDLIGSTSLDVDALVAGMGVTQDLIAAANTNLTAMINKQELVFDYLADLSGDLGTVISKQNSVLSALETVNQSLTSVTNRLYYDGGSLAYWSYRINHFLRNDFATKLDAVLALLQEEDAFTTDISGVLENQQDVVDTLTSITTSLSSDGSIVSALNDLGLTTAVNIGLLQGKVIDGNMVLEDIRNILGNDQSWFNKRLESMITLLTNISDALSDDGYIGDELHDIAVDTNLIYIKLGAFQEQQNTLADQISKSLTHNNYSVAYYVWALGGLVERSFESVLANQSTALPVLQGMSESLTKISDRLYYVDASVSYYVWNISSQLRNNLPILIANQEATIVNQQKLIDLIEDLELTTNVTIENIENITIDVTNKAYEVFYITDSEGNEQNLADFSGDVLTISGRLLNFFFKVAFDDALDSVDSALDDMTEFYIDDSVLVGGGSLWE